MLYRPPFEDWITMIERLTAKYHRDLARVQGTWELWETPEGHQQLAPVILIDFKGMI